MRLSGILCYIILFTGSVSVLYAQQAYPENYFRAPLDIPMHLSGNFAELRADHFHSGIDIKTQGVTGKRVYAVADGYISRIKIESGGYGRTLYINHPEGYTTVYAHLNNFTPDISQVVKMKQYETQKHAVDIYPGKNQFPVKKGDVVAASGNSGYSFGPHLHFEIRNAANQHPLNVLSFGFDINDDVKPVIYSLFLYPVGNESVINDLPEKISLPVSGTNGNYTLPQEGAITAFGKVGIGLEAYDYLNGSSNRCGIFSVDLLVNNRLINRMKMDEFSFGESRYINSLMDYEEKMKNNRNVFKTYIEPNNGLSIYESQINSGIIDIEPDTVYNIQMVLKDVYGNDTELTFSITGGQPPSQAFSDDAGSNAIDLSWQELTNFERDGIQLTIPPNSFYTDIAFTYSTSEPVESTFSKVHHVHNQYTPVHLPFELKIKPDNLPGSLTDKAILVTLDDEGDISYAGGEWKDGLVIAQTRSFGLYAVAIDTTEPDIKPLNIPQSLDMSDKESVRFKVTDDLSGIQSYEGYINNEWALFEYDAKNDLVYYIFDPERIAKGTSHELELYIIDNKNNISFYYTEFYW